MSGVMDLLLGLLDAALIFGHADGSDRDRRRETKDSPTADRGEAGARSAGGDGAGG